MDLAETLRSSLCPTEKDFGMSMSSAFVSVGMCGGEGERGAVGLGKVTKMGQLTLSIDQQGWKFTSLYTEPSFQVKGYFYIHKYHTCK